MCGRLVTENMDTQYRTILLCACLLTISQATLYPGAVDQVPISNGPPQDMTQGWMPTNDKQAEENYIRALQNRLIHAKRAPSPEQLPLESSISSSSSSSSPKPPVQAPPKISLSAWLHKQLPPLLPLNLLLQLLPPQMSQVTPANRPFRQTSERRVPPLILRPRQPSQQESLPPSPQQLSLRKSPQQPFLQSSLEQPSLPTSHRRIPRQPPLGSPPGSVMQPLQGPPPPQPPQGHSPFQLLEPYNSPPQQSMAYMPPRPYMFSRPGSAECSGGYVPGQLCCDGIVNPLPPGGFGRWGCCHKGIMDVTTQVCCGDVPMPKPTKGPPLMCCGTTLYNPATHLCCDTFPVANPSGLMRCCRKIAYNPATEMCCAEAVKPRIPLQIHMECCGKHMFNSMTHMCCDEGNAIPRDPSLQCCGKNFFEPAVQQCCLGDALPRDAACAAP